ncbi:MAG: MATE family efflux transporter [Acidimicrobiia bacterium]|nr:MATE family efflux transporter [Acidimicrobiia bacterium]
MTEDRSGRSLDRQIFRLAVPALGTLAADPLVSLVDTAFVGRLGKVPLGGLGVAAAIFSIAFFMFNFLAYGTTPLIAGALARQERDKAGRITGAALMLGLALGVALTAVLLLTAEPLVRLMGAESELLNDAVLYLRIRVLGMPALLLATVGHGVFRGHQNTRTPLWVTLGISAVNLVLDPILIFGLGWGLAGAAWATMLAQWSGAAVFTALFVRRRREFALRLRWPGRESLQPLVGAGRALVIRSGSLLAAFTLATAIATRQGEEVVAAHQVAVQLWIFLALVVDALAIAAQALVGLHLDGDATLARAYARRLLGWGLVVGLVLLGVMAAGRGLLPGVFSSDAEVIAQVDAVYLFIVLMQPLNAVVFVWDGIAIGASAFTYLATSTVAASLATALTLVAVQQQAWGLAGVWWSLVAMMAVRFATLAYWHLTGPVSSARDRSPGSPAAV